MNLKGERVASSMLKELSNIFLTEVKDEDLKNVTLTFATVTNDLSFAKIYFTTLDDDKKDKVLKDINKASGYFRSELAKRLEIRHIPEIRFIYDESIEYGRKIEEVLKRVNEK